VLLLALVALALPIGLAACRPAQATPEAVTSEAEGQAAATDEPAAANESTLPTPAGDFDVYGSGGQGAFETTDSGLQIDIIEQGDGAVPQAGELVSVHYTGWLTDGTQFDSSIERGQPISFPLGQGGVIPGWDEGISLLNEGGKARLVIPPDLAYGAAGAGGVIPPDATLVFDVELVGIRAGAPEEPEDVAEDDYEVTDGGVKIYDVVEGDGPVVEEGQQLTFHYTAWLEDGTRFDSSLLQGQPASVIFGSGLPIPGWDIGLTGMKVGGIRQVVIPPDQAFGDEGAGGGIIPPGATLIFLFELLDATEANQ
jgi:peptidylprolyl isomerase